MAQSPKNNGNKPKKNSAGRVAFKAAGFTVDAASSVLSSVFKIFGSLLLILLIAALLFACVFAYYVKNFLTPQMDLSLEDYQLSESSTIWYQNSAGEYQELVTLAGQYKRIWVDYEDIPKYMEQALVAIEDKRFYQHKGVDWYRTSGAFVKMFAKMETNFGGSTITQQLIKNLTGRDEVTIQRKLGEIFGALELEKKYDKQEIMEWYLNAVYFGESCYGVQAAAQTYFGKDVKDLTLAECASIVGITNKPTYYDPFYNEENNKQRQLTILREMYEQEYIDFETYKAACAEELVFKRSPGSETVITRPYTYYEEVVINDVLKDLMDLKGISYDAARTLLYNGGYQIYCCIDTNIQSIVDSIYTDLNNFKSRSSQQLQSAIVIMNPYDGRILALSGGVGEKTRSFELNRAVPISVNGFSYGGTQRSPGSSIKPLASYAPAINEGLITPNTLVDDSSNIYLRGTSWYPHNDDNRYYGTLTITDALKWSRNTVAAQIVDILPNGPQTSVDYLTQRLGFTSIVTSGDKNDVGYASMSLGQLTNGVSVREMTQAYCALVNDGIFTYSRTYSMVTDSRGNIVIDNAPQTIAAFDPNTAYCMTYMMRKVVEEGTGTEAQLWSVPVAGKTGTSGEYKDRWFAGITPYYAAVVWTGFDIPEVINGSGNPSAKLWKQVMSKVHSGLDWKEFNYPYLGPDTGVFRVVQVETTPNVIVDGGYDSGVLIDGGYGYDNGYNYNGGYSADNGGTYDNGSGGVIFGDNGGYSAPDFAVPEQNYTAPDPYYNGNNYNYNNSDPNDGSAAIIFG